MVIYSVVASLVLIPPFAGVAIIILDVQNPPRWRTPLALGSVVSLHCFSLGILGTAHALLNGQLPLFNLILALPLLIIWRSLALIPKSSWDILG